MIKPLNDNVLLKKEIIENTTKSGIILSTNENQEDNIGVVIAIGPGKTVEGKLVPTTLKKGDRVIFDKYGTTEVKYNDEEYLLLPESKVFAVIE